MKKILLCISLILVVTISYAQQVFMQGWYWDYPKTANGYSWADTLRLEAASLKAAGFTHIWFPPHAIASSGPNSNGYDPKDLFIGNQTSGLGTRTALNNMLAEFTAQGIAPVADLIYNHRDGGSAENNSAVKDYITNYYNAAKEPYPSDRFRCILPLGGSSGNGAGDYYFKLASKTGDARFNNYTYKLYMQTNTVGYQGTPDLNEMEPNGGGDCGQPDNDIFLGKNLFGTVETGGSCNTDEYHLHLNATDFNPAGDTIFIYMNNTGGYSDHRFYGIYSSSRGIDIVNDLQYQTYTDYSNIASGRGQMNFEFFKPNSANASTTYLSGAWDGMYFFYDYDQFQKQTQDTLINWTKWNWDELGVRGLRMDAVKHFTPAFVGHMLDSMHTYGKDPSLVVGEWYSTNPSELGGWINDVKANMSAGAQAAIQPKIFDFALRDQLRQACDDGGFDARNVFNGSLHDAGGVNGYNIVTFTNNHDFRDASGFASLIRNNTDLAYAYILTNNQLGVPTVFYPDYFGYPAPSGGMYSYHPTNLPPYKPQIDALINILQKYINGSPSVDYLNRFSTPYSSNYISGSADKALIYQLQGPGSTGNNDVIVAINFGNTRLQVDQQINTRGGSIGTGMKFYDALGNSAFPYQQVDASGNVYIDIPARSYSVWVQSNTVLPISLLSFTAAPLQNQVTLQWKIATEINVEKYTVERSENAGTYTAIGDVTATNKVSPVYSLVDADLPAASYIYYRLKIIDKDGSTKYSNVIKVKLKTPEFNISISPNPVAAKNITLSIEAQKASTLAISIYNAQGQKVYEQKINNVAGTAIYPLSVATLSSGTYNLTVNNGAKKITKQFIKQ